MTDPWQGSPPLQLDLDSDVAVSIPLSSHPVCYIVSDTFDPIRHASVGFDAIHGPCKFGAVGCVQRKERSQLEAIDSHFFQAFQVGVGCWTETAVVVFYNT